MHILPLFKSHYSIGRSILTLNKKGTSQSDGANSIVDIAVENNFKTVFLIDNSFSGFLEAYKNLLDCKINLVFGLSISCTKTIDDKSEDSFATTHKINLIAKNHNGYKKLIKIYSKAATDGFYYVPRIDYNIIKEFVDSSEIDIWIPFYDSYLYRNILEGKKCIPDFNGANPKYIHEDNGLPFDILIQDILNEMKSKDENMQIIKGKTILYKNKSDFPAYLTFRCIDNRTTLDKPELQHMSSNQFCFESWLEKERLNA